MFNVGDLIEVIDQIDPEVRTQGTVRLVEADDEVGGYWLYIRANDESLNVLQDPRIPGGYFAMLNSEQTDRIIDLRAKEM